MDLKAKGKFLFSQLGGHLLKQLPFSPWRMKSGFTRKRRSIASLRGILLLGYGYGHNREVDQQVGLMVVLG